MTNLKLLSEWNHGIARAIEVLGTDEFFPSLIAAVEQQIDVSYPQFWIYHRDLPPRALYHDIPPHAVKSQIDDYLEGPFSEDPFFRTSLNRPKNKIYMLSRMTTSELKNSNYYNSYYAHTGTVDEAVFLTVLGNGSVINLSLMRLPSQGIFSESDYQLMYSLADTVSALIDAHSSHKPFAIDNLIQPGIDHQIDLAFRTFGESLLSPREKDVLELMLRGYGTDTSAARLSIARETVRRHRKSIYRKLDVNSQTDLFSLFLNAMSCLGEAAGADPLSIYMAPG
ncbi:MAG: helix-turn-helix transcriptional regulator [Congregibacter sp.]